MTGTGRGRLRGYALVLAGSVLFGLAATFSKVILDGGVDPLAVSLYTQLVAGVVYLPTVRRRMFGPRDWRILAFLGSVGGVLAPVLYFTGIQRTTAANAALLQNGEPLFTIVFAYLFLGERLGRRGYPMVAVIAAGAFIVATNLDFSGVAFGQFLLGNLLLVGAAACWGLDNNASAVLTKRASIPAVLSVRLLLGCAFLVPVLLLAGTPLAVSPESILLLVVFSLLSIAVYAFIIYHAFRAIGPLRSGAVLSTSALWGVLIALYVFPAQVPSSVQLAGGALMVLALVGLYAFGEPKATEPSSGPETLKAGPPDGPGLP